jgi:hypothetical protein
MFSFLDMYDFLFRPRKEAPFLIEGGPYGTYRSNLIQGQDENKLVKLSSRNSVGLAWEGENFFAIVRQIYHNGWSGIELYGSVFGFPIDLSGGIPDPGPCHLIAAKSSTSVKVIKAIPGRLPFHLIAVDPARSICDFVFPAEFLFCGKSILYR